MSSVLGAKEREHFSDRLKDALSTSGFPLTPSAFVYAYNLRADGAAVSVYAARKWLLGEAIPAQERIKIIADWLGISAAWLRFGDADNSDLAPACPPSQRLAAAELAFVHDVRLLSDENRSLLRSIVDTMLRHATEVTRDTGSLRTRSRRAKS